MDVFNNNKNSTNGFWFCFLFLFFPFILVLFLYMENVGVYICCFQYGETPLHMAAKNGSDEAAKLLLAKGANIEAKACVCYPIVLLVVKLHLELVFRIGCHVTF